jgi:hypothetical protein
MRSIYLLDQLLMFIIFGVSVALAKNYNNLHFTHTYTIKNVSRFLEAEKQISDRISFMKFLGFPVLALILESYGYLENEWLGLEKINLSRKTSKTTRC